MMDGKADLVLRGGTVVDGTGAPAFTANVAVKDGRIVAVTQDDVAAQEEIDASGKLVTPGFVDLHTHFDGQVTWDERLGPSSEHGVTTVIMGNCGVGFAPCRPEMRDALVQLMEGVEDIPGVVLAEGLPWTWESFPEYLDFLETRHCDVDFATQVPHAPVRVHVMGARGVARERATRADMQAMADLVKEGIAAGALGFSTSRALQHRASDGSLSPTVTAGEDELRAIAKALAEVGAGVIEVADTMDDTTADYSTDFEMWKRIVRESGRPFSYGLIQLVDAPDRWRHLLDFGNEANAEGLNIKAQVMSRPLGLLYGLSVSTHAFTSCPSYMEIAHLPLAERVEAMRDPARKARILGDVPTDRNVQWLTVHRDVGALYEMADPPNYLPAAEEKISARAAAAGVDPLDLAYDLMLKDEGRAILFLPLQNYAFNSVEAIKGMLTAENVLIGIGDGGAHMGLVCDASLPTFLLTHWVRRDDPLMSIERAVKMLSLDNARFIGLHDRGVIAPGYKADLNVIDLDRLHLHRPHPEHDLPAGGLRLKQRADGYVATIVSGKVTYRDGQPTGALPGRLIRGTRQAPVPALA